MRCQLIQSWLGRGADWRGTASLMVVMSKPYSLLCLTPGKILKAVSMKDLIVLIMALNWAHRFRCSLNLYFMGCVNFAAGSSSWRMWAWLSLGSLKFDYAHQALFKHIVQHFLCQYSMICLSGLFYGKWRVPSSKFISKNQMCYIISFSKSNINWDFSTTWS